jgi:hypothetical protein
MVGKTFSELAGDSTLSGGGSTGGRGFDSGDGSSAYSQPEASPPTSRAAIHESLIGIFLASRARKQPTPPVLPWLVRPGRDTFAPISDTAESVPEMTVALRLSAIPQEKLRQNG